MNSYARYSGLAFEMMGMLLGGVFLGIKLDEVTSLKPLFTVVLSLMGFIIALWFAIRNIPKQ